MTPARAGSPDDLVMPFRAEASGVLGRLVRLGAVADTVLSRHDYPDEISRVLGEALALAALLGAALKYDSKLTLQTKSDGPLNFLVVDYESPGKLRGYASFERARIGKIASGPAGAMLGQGHLAMTIDPGEDMDRYQGIVALSGGTLTESALTYFRQSEQLPTFLRLAVARHYGGLPDGSGQGWRWRAGGLLIQHLTEQGGSARPAVDRMRGDGSGWDLDDDWERTRLLAATVEDHELLDPLLTPERLLYRLFHEEGVRTFATRPLAVHCTCSRDRLGQLLQRFSVAELADMAEADGRIRATCEFCNTAYLYGAGELHG
mgnify:CR=1 FL=1